MTTGVSMSKLNNKISIMKITLLHPSRSRPEIAKETYLNWLNKSSGKHELEHIFSLDFSDPLNEGYTRFDKLTIDHNDCLVEAVNEGAKIATGDIILVLSDDFDCPQNWDELIINAFGGQKCKLLKVFDGVQKWIITLPIMDMDYYKMQGYVYFPLYKHMFADTHMSHKGDLEGNIIWRNDLLFEHKHYSTGKSKKDAVNIKADSTWEIGEAVYLNQIKMCFGLGDIDPLAINENAGECLKWIKRKLK